MNLISLISNGIIIYAVFSILVLGYFFTIVYNKVMAKNDLKIGVDVGASKVLVARIQNGKVVAREKIYFSNRSEAYILKSVFSAIDGVADGRKVKKIGIGVPCVIAGGKARRCFNIPILEKIDLKEILEKKYGAKVTIMNDTKAMLRYELWRNSALRKKRVLFIAWGTGIGSAFSINGQIQEGPRGLAGEIGHSIVCIEGGGSLEDYAAGRTFQPKGKSLWLQEVLDNKNSRRSKLIFSKIGQGLGIGILNAIYHYDPDMIIIGGGLYRFLPFTIPHIRKTINQNALIPDLAKIKIIRSHLPEDAGVLGSVLY